MITSQVPVDRWHDMIGVPTLADAILDRVIHNAYRIDLAGESLRKPRSSSEIEALLTNPDNPNIIDFDPAEANSRWPTSNRNPGRLQIGIGGRTSDWNAWPASSVFADQSQEADCGEPGRARD